MTYLLQALAWWIRHPIILIRNPMNAACDLGLMGCALHKKSGWYEPAWKIIRYGPAAAERGDDQEAQPEGDAA